jgi:hypothetical protein
LAQVERDLRAASEDIAHQHETLRNLQRHGEDTTEAVRSIGILEDTRLAEIRDTDYRTKTFSCCRCGTDGAARSNSSAVPCAARDVPSLRLSSIWPPAS